MAKRTETSETRLEDIPAAPGSGTHMDAIEQLKAQASLLSTVPDKRPDFVPYGDYELSKTLVASRKFVVIFETGQTGIGKTLNWKQACAETEREFIRCNITTETDEDDLLGGFRLRNGETVFDFGPVPVAMIRGSVLLIDEVDKASEKIMCLQPVLEGEPVTLKKIGITIKPAPGFMIVATANTKGHGDDTGKFVTSRILDEAFLERFDFTLEHGYPPIEVENKILTETFKAEGGTLTPSTKAYFKTLATWAENIRASFLANSADDTISTRRLVKIVRTFNALGATDKRNQGKAIVLCLNRYSAKTKDTFIDLYNKHVNDDGTPSNVGTAAPPKNF